MKVASALLVISFTVFVLPRQVGAVDWEDIHCAGSDYHNEEGDPPEESTEPNNYFCHGMPGDSGQCAMAIGDTNISVSCSVTFRGTFCQGSLYCGGGGTPYYCAGPGKMVFGGFAINPGGIPWGFLECVSSAGVEKFQCGTPV